jgi:hypothetical protein
MSGRSIGLKQGSPAAAPAAGVPTGYFSLSIQGWFGRDRFSPPGRLPALFLGQLLSGPQGILLFERSNPLEHTALPLDEGGILAVRVSGLFHPLKSFAENIDEPARRTHGFDRTLWRLLIALIDAGLRKKVAYRPSGLTEHFRYLHEI